MAKSEFSESTYGQVVTSELMGRYNAAVNAGRIRRATTVVIADLPSLPQEALVGYDVMFPFPEAAPLCFQYKLSDELSARKHATVKRDKVPAGSDLEAPAYEFEVRKAQNDTLLRLQKQIVVKVFYCAPKFWRFAVLNQHAGSQTVLQNSFLLAPPSLTGKGQKHVVYFDLTNRNHYICSEPRKLEGVHEFRSLIELVYKDRRNVRDLLEEILAKLKQDLGRERQLWETVDASLETEQRYEREWGPEPMPPYYWRSLALYRWIKRIIYLHYGADFHLT